MKTESLLSQISSSKPSSTADAEIFNVHRVLLDQKSLTKTSTLGPKNHPRNPVVWLTVTSSMHIDYFWHLNRWRKLSPWFPKNHHQNPVIWLTLKSSMCIDYCWLRNRWRKLGPSDPKNHPRSPFPRLTLTSSTQILLMTDKPLMKTQSLLSQKSSSKPSCPADAEIFIVLRLLWLRNRWRKLGPSDPKIIQEAQFYAWRWHLLRT